MEKLNKVNICNNGLLLREVGHHVATAEGRCSPQESTLNPNTTQMVAVKDQAIPLTLGLVPFLVEGIRNGFLPMVDKSDTKTIQEFKEMDNVAMNIVENALITETVTFESTGEGNSYT